MAIWIFVFLLASRAISYGVTARTDSVPPIFTWVSPAFLSIITTNTIRVAVEAHDNPGGSGVDKVRFYAKYLNDNGIYSESIPIGVVTATPYEIIWDCTQIPDQNYGKLSFTCEVYDHAGNISIIDSYGYNKKSSFVLDRHILPRNSTLRSHRTRTAIRIDGNMNEWAFMDSISFANNDNIVKVFSLWDRNNLYFGIRVTDQSLIGIHTPFSVEIENMPSEDIAEIYIEPHHDHSAVFADACRHYLISVAGKVYEERWHLERNSKTLSPTVNLHPYVIGKCIAKGTVNVEGDTDRYYTIEFAIPWKELETTPRNRKTMGLEIWNSDRDYRFGNSSYAGWTTTAPNLKNPSEWGDIVLLDDHSVLQSVLICTLPILFCLSGAYVAYSRYRRRKTPSSENLEIPYENNHIRKAKVFIEEHYWEDTLSREDIAHHVGLNASYFGKLFKAETGEHLSDYLIKIRIEKAKKLILTTQKNISEIAFEVGFNSQSYFGYIFKKKERCSPKEFRTNHR